MASLLYRLGAASYRRRRAVILGWVLVLVLTGALSGLMSKGTTNSFSIPGTPAQTALNSLAVRFPEVSGGQAQMIVVAPSGQQVSAPPLRATIGSAIAALSKTPGVASVADPFSDLVSGGVSEDGSAALVTIQTRKSWDAVTDAERADLVATAAPLRAAGAQVEFGGQVFASTGPALSATEAAGVVVALIVLLVTFGSMRAAGLPLITALAGVILSMALVLASSAFVDISATVPLLALMIGLAVGIDYALFILSRHRDQLADGMDPPESAAQAVATAGSAVVFAGLTVMIALVGLFVAGIPFLTTMGLAAAGAVLIAVLVALTLLPAIFGVSGAKLRPKPKTSPRSRQGRQQGRFAQRWVGAVTKYPLVSILLVVTALSAMAIPAKDLRLALPGNGIAPAQNTERKAFDLISERFGPGHNAPMLLTADIIRTTDPIGVVNGIADQVRQLPGVAAISLATPNRTGDTGVVVVIPDQGAESPSTEALVGDLRALAGPIKAKYGVDIGVTGQAALAIDVSDRLAGALLPFGLLVVGMSLVLLGAVFRSIAVPIKATIGYLLSVGASFGAVAAVFEWGWLAGPLGVEQTGPVISFMPIILMGVLFGLAMDYEVFLVSRMREEYVHTSDPQRAVTVGYVAGAKVVTAAALIMVSVFAAFVPHGDPSIKPIAFALAVGVLVDAFVVRMILVPAVLSMLGHAAWWLPRWLDVRLPRVDIEGEQLHEQKQLADWPYPGCDDVIHAEGLTLAGRGGPAAAVDLAAPAGGVLVVHGPQGSGKTALLLALAGRLQVQAGHARVAGHLLPSQMAAVRSRVALAELPGINDLDATRTVEQHIAERIATLSLRLWVPRARVAEVLNQVDDAIVAATGQRATLGRGTVVADLLPLERRVLALVLALIGAPPVLVVDDVDTLHTPAEREQLWRALAWLSGRATIVASCQDPGEALEVMPPGQVRLVDLAPAPAPARLEEVH
jgi:putative drug exporter of the RND superfamily